MAHSTKLQAPLFVSSLLWSGGNNNNLYKIPYHTFSTTAKKRRLRLKPATDGGSFVEVAIISNEPKPFKSSNKFSVVRAALPLALVWGDPNSTQNEILLENIVEVASGIRTDSFWAFVHRAPRSSIPHESCCFSIIGVKRTVDFYVWSLGKETLANDSHLAASWLTAIQELLGRFRLMQSGSSKSSVKAIKRWDPRHRKVLFKAAVEGDIEMLRWLFEIGCPADYMDHRSGDTVLLVACRLGLVDVAKLALQDYHALNDPHPEFGQTALQVAVSAGHADIVELILSTAEPSGHDRIITNHEDENGEAPIHVAARCGSLEIMQLLVKHDADLGLVDRRGRTCLHCSAQAGHAHCLEYSLNFGAGEFIDVRQEGGFTCLHVAIKSNRLDCVEVLLRAGADIYVVSDDGSNAHDIAAKSRNNSIVSLLLEYADSDSNDSRLFHGHNSFQNITQDDNRSDSICVDMFRGLKTYIVSPRIQNVDAQLDTDAKHGNRHNITENIRRQTLVNSISHERTSTQSFCRENERNFDRGVEFNFANELWVIHYTEDGFPYYYSVDRNFSTWDDPRTTPATIQYHFLPEQNQVPFEVGKRKPSQILQPTISGAPSPFINHSNTSKKQQSTAPCESEKVTNTRMFRNGTLRQPSEIVLDARSPVKSQDTVSTDGLLASYVVRPFLRDAIPQQRVGEYQAVGNDGPIERVDIKTSENEGSSFNEIPRQDCLSNMSQGFEKSAIIGAKNYRGVEHFNANDETATFNDCKDSKLRLKFAKVTEQRDAVSREDSSYDNCRKPSNMSSPIETIMPKINTEGVNELGIKAILEDAKTAVIVTGSSFEGKDPYTAIDKNFNSGFINGKFLANIFNDDKTTSTAATPNVVSGKVNDREGELSEAQKKMLTDDEEEIASKYRKMIKMKVPLEDVMRKMTADGVNVSIITDILGGSAMKGPRMNNRKSNDRHDRLPSPHSKKKLANDQSFANMVSSNAATETTSLTCHGGLSTTMYNDDITKLTAVTANIVSGCVNEKEEKQSEAQKKSLTDDEEAIASKYRKMIKMKVPLDAVRHKMTIDGVHVSIIADILGDSALEGSIKSNDDSKDCRERLPSPPMKTEKKSQEVLSKDDLASDPSMAKFVKMTKVGVPLSAVVLKMNAEGVNDEKIALFKFVYGIETPTKTSSPRVMPPLRKERRRASKALQKIHWNAVSEDKLRDSVWERKSEAETEINDSEISQLESLFSLSPVNTVGAKRSNIAAKSRAKKQQISLIDPKRANNIAISLAQFRSFDNYDKLCEAVVSMDQSKLDLEKLSNMELLLPTPEELKR